jgi:DNA-binding response OmpR family regulator
MPSSARILVAEDDAGIRDIIRTRLQAAGYNVEVARNGIEALAKITASRPAAMILDINMPELDGFGVLESMAGHVVRTPVLVLTARHAADDVRRAISLGAKDYLAKPFSESQLLARVARLLRAKREVKGPWVLV